MDPIDAQLLRLLISDAKTTNARLAREVGLSESATLERVRRLEKTGVIGGYTTQVEPADIGLGLEVIMNFTLHNQSVQDLHRFEAAMVALDEVLSCAQVLGRFDFVAHVAVRDIPALQQLINDKLIALGVISRMESFTIFKNVKRYRAPAPRAQA